VSDGLLRAAELTPRTIRTLDSIHLASARRIDADRMLVYDRRLRRTAQALEIRVVHPGMAE